MPNRSKVAAPSPVSRAKIAEIALDPEFRDLVPHPAPEESAELAKAIFQDGMGEPLYIWNWKGRLILLIGYQLFPALATYRLTYPIIEKSFASRVEARQFILAYYLRHRMVTRMALSYYRGQRCLPDKLTQGGDRKSEAFRKTYGPRMTLAALAEVYQVSRQTLCNDLAFARAVDVVAANGGEGIKRLILSRDTTLTRGRVLALAELEVEEQKRLLRDLAFTGQLPRSLGRSSQPTITVPRKLGPMARTLLRRLGPKRTKRLGELLGQVLARLRKKQEGGKNA